jgi:hypothetical protein
VKLRAVVSHLKIDPRKLIDYALDPESLKGTDKALMFRQHLGFTKETVQPLLTQIEAQALDAETTPDIEDQHGCRYQVDLSIIGLKPGQQETVRTGWMVRPGEDIARLVTLYVRRRR